MADESDQKTEEPTGKKLGEAFGKGQFPRSPDVQVAIMLLVAVYFVGVQLPDLAREVASFSAHSFRMIGAADFTAEQIGGEAIAMLKFGLKLVAPFLLLVFLGSVLGGGAQSKFRLTLEALSFSLDKLNPTAGFKKLFSVEQLMTLPFDVLKFAGVGLALWIAIKKILRDPLFYSPMEVGHLARFLNDVAATFLGWVAGAMTVIAIGSYAYQHYKVFKDLRMTKQEVKDEHKQAEGDPMIKGRRRRMALQLMQKQMLGAVPTADVVVTNPTHYAVALKYERGVDAAPVVLAKGKNLFAKRIKDLARENGVPIVENKPLARMLYKHGEVGEAVPVQVYQAVAEVLAFVYRTHRYYFHQLRGRRAAASAEKAAGAARPLLA